MFAGDFSLIIIVNSVSLEWEAMIPWEQRTLTCLLFTHQVELLIVLKNKIYRSTVVLKMYYSRAQYWFKRVIKIYIYISSAVFRFKLTSILWLLPETFWYLEVYVDSQTCLWGLISGIHAHEYNGSCKSYKSFNAKCRLLLKANTYKMSSAMTPRWRNRLTRLTFLSHKATSVEGAYVP